MSYRLADGTLVSCDGQAAWCFACETIRSMEQFPEVDVLADRVRKLELDGINEQVRKIAGMLDKDPAIYLSELIFGLRATISWREGR
jgi:hypothetical protein